MQNKIVFSSINRDKLINLKDKTIILNDKTVNFTVNAFKEEREVGNSFIFTTYSLQFPDELNNSPAFNSFLKQNVDNNLGSQNRPLEYFNSEVEFKRSDNFSVSFIDNKRTFSTDRYNTFQSLLEQASPPEQTIKDFYRGFLSENITPNILLLDPNIVEINRAITSNSADVLFSNTQQKNLFFDKDYVKKIEEHNSKYKNILPYYAEIHIPLNIKSSTNEFKDSFSETNVFNKKNFQNFFLMVTSASIDTLPINIQTLYPVAPTASAVNYFNQIIEKPQSTDFKIYKSVEGAQANTPRPDLVNEISVSSSLATLLQSQKTNHELVLVIVEKFIENDTTPIQKFYFYPDDNMNSITFVDNQIYKNKIYRYELKYLILSYGIKYYYEKNSEPQTNTNQTYKPVYTYKIAGEFPYRFIKIPHSKAFINVSETAPQKSFISFLSEYNKPNSILGLIETYTLAEKNPLNINELDLKYFNDVKSADGIVFFLDEDVEKYEIFRLETPPTSYNDFQQVHLTVGGTNKAFIDQLTPNKRYFYTARSVKGLAYSSPSDIYTVEMVYDKGAVIPKIGLYNIKTKEDFIKNSSEPSKAIKKYLKISPAYAQMRLHETFGVSGSFKESKFDLSVAENVNCLDSIWQNKFPDIKFKVRLTSKTTGKKVDLNLNFKYTTKNNFEE
jgi:hypothetical protein